MAQQTFLDIPALANMAAFNNNQPITVMCVMMETAVRCGNNPNSYYYHNVQLFSS